MSQFFLDAKDKPLLLLFVSVESEIFKRTNRLGLPCCQYHINALYDCLNHTFLDWRIDSATKKQESDALINIIYSGYCPKNASLLLNAVMKITICLLISLKIILSSIFVSRIFIQKKVLWQILQHQKELLISMLHAYWQDFRLKKSKPIKENMSSFQQRPDLIFLVQLWIIMNNCSI